MAEWKKIEDMPADFEGDVWIVTEELNNSPTVLLCHALLNHRKEIIFSDYGRGDRADEWKKVTHYIPLIEPELPTREV